MCYVVFVKNYYPEIDVSLCTHCGLCIQACVAHAINPATMAINSNRCIACSHCSAICPVAAVKWPKANDEPDIPALADDVADQLETLIKRRRSMRVFDRQAVPEGLINRILETVNHAPTGTNSRGVHVTVVRGEAEMKAMADLTMSFFRRIASLLLGPLGRPFLWLFGGQKMVRRIKGYKRHIDGYFTGKNILTFDAPVLFVFSAHRKSSCPSQDAVIWATTANLHAEALGLGTCYNGFIVLAASLYRPLRRYLGVPKGCKVYSTFLAGYPGLKYKRAAHRAACRHNFVSNQSVSHQKG